REWPSLKTKIPKHYFMRPFYLGYVIIAVNTCVWSAVYHSRDWPWTEKLDYFSAATSIMFRFYYAVIRILRITNQKTQIIWGICCLIPLLAHISYLTFVKFDYGYNMLATASVGVFHNLWWIIWSIKHWKTRKSYAWQPTVLVSLISVAMCLEILDFPPFFGIIDAHSLSHLATVPLIPLWYKFLFADTEWEVTHAKNKIHTTKKKD